MTPKPTPVKPEALPAVYPDVEPGDHVYFRHPERGPMSAKVLATGKHGLTATCPMGDLYRVHWERVLGVKARMNRKFKLVENGAEGCILEDDRGERRYVAHAEDEEDDEGEKDGKPLHKSQPTPAQIEAGNYKKRHIRFQGLAISIENPAGSVRRGKDRDGHEWRTKMVHAYGYIRGSKGVDKDHVDCYVGPNPDAGHAYIIHQRKAGQWDRFDEDKVMLGFDTEAQAKAAYLKHYDDPRFLGPVTAMPMDEFKRKVLATAERPAMIKAFPDHARALFLKARVKAHLRHLPSGKVATVGAYTDRRRERDESTGDLFAEAAEKPKDIGIDAKRAKRVAERFGLTEKEVTDALSTPTNELVARNEHAENNKMDAPAEFKRYPVGSAQIDEYGSMENRYINFLREFDPKDLAITEAEEGIKQHPTYQKYVQWAKEGKEPPYVFVAQTDKGTLQVTNRRRTLAAREAGRKLKGWYGPANRETGNPLKYGDVKRAYDELSKG